LSNPLRSPENPTFCLCAAPQNSPSAAHQAQSNNHPHLALCLAPPLHQTKPIGHGPCSGLVQSIFSSPARLRSPSLPAYTCCRRAAKLKMLCTIPSPGLCRATSHAHRAQAGIYGVNVTCHLRAARHSIRALQAVEKGEELVARSIATGRAIQRRCPGERLLLHRQGCLQVDLGRFNRFVAEPQGNHRPVHARLQ